MFIFERLNKIIELDLTKTNTGPEIAEFLSSKNNDNLGSDEAMAL